MGKHGETRIRLGAALASGLVAIALGGIGAAPAHAGTMSFVPQDGDSTDWTTDLNPDGWSDPSILPGGFGIDGQDPPPPPDYRAHSDVPDLPDGPGSSSTSLYQPPDLPGLSGTFDGNLKPYLTRPYDIVPLDGSGSSGLAPDSLGLPALSMSPIPAPGAVLLFGAAGLGGLGRRRRR